MIKAYRVLNVDYQKTPSFNIWQDEKLVEYLSDKFAFFIMLDDDGVGFGVLPTEAIQSALLNVAMTETVRAMLSKDLLDSRKTGWIRYMFYYES